MIFLVFGGSEGSEGVVRVVVLFVVIREVVGGSCRPVEVGSVRSRGLGAGVSIVEGMFRGIEESTVVMVAEWEGGGVAEVLE